jgi:2-oxoglutarate ferredoxin oxidoreductase subunit alpha
MRWNILVGGQAGQGINLVSEIASEILTSYGYYVFNYKDYSSVIRGGHNFNIISISDKPIMSFEESFDCILSMDEKTKNLHKNSLKKDGVFIDGKLFSKYNRNVNIALSGSLMKIFGIDKQSFINSLKKKFSSDELIKAGSEGYDSFETKFSLSKLNRKINIMSGSQAVALSAVSSGLNRYISYPMTPSTEVLHELASMQLSKKNLMVFQAENEIAVVNSGLGASFAGANVMVGTSGGGFDLMSEGLSFQGMSEIPLTVYLASRPGPGTGVPTYSSQSDLDIALRAGHGEFPRVVVAPGDAYDCIGLTSEALYLASKFNSLSIILSDKHVAESQFSFGENIPSSLKIKKNRKIPQEEFVKSNSYEHDKYGNTIEDAKLTIEGHNLRLKKYSDIKDFCKKFDMIKIYGKKESDNLIIGWGSTKGAIIDSIKKGNLDCRFLQVLYIKPLSDKIKSEINKAKNVYLVEYNSTGQLGRLIREKTGFSIPNKNRILKYDGRPFSTEELLKELNKRGIKEK